MFSFTPDIRFIYACVSLSVSLCFSLSLSLSLSLALSHTHKNTRTNTHTRARAHTHTHTHARTHTHTLNNVEDLIFLLKFAAESLDVLLDGDNVEEEDCTSKPSLQKIDGCFLVGHVEAPLFLA